MNENNNKLINNLNEANGSPYIYIYINDIIKNSERFLIPTFQRNYVWKKENIKSLLESISKKIPIPLIYIWDFNCKEIEGSTLYYLKNDINSTLIEHSSANLQIGDHHYIVIDGQQRLTSLKIAFSKTNINKWFVKTEFVNINIGWKYEFYTAKIKESEDDILLADIFDQNDEKYDSLKKIFKESYLVGYYAGSDYTFEDITKIFHKINSTGKGLKFGDIFLNSIKTKKAQNKIKKIGDEGIPVNLIHNTCLLLADINPIIIKLATINKSAEDFDDKLKDSYEKIFNDLDRYLKFSEINDDLRTFVLKNFNTCCVMYFIVKHVLKNDNSDKKILYLLLLLFSVGKANSQGEIEKFYNKITNLEKDKFSLSWMCKCFTGKELRDFLTEIIDTNDTNIQKVILYVLMENDYVNQNLKFDHLDHLIAKSFFGNDGINFDWKEYGKESKRFDRISNKQFLYSKWNISKSDTDLNRYIKDNPEQYFYADPFAENRGEAIEQQKYSKENFKEFYDKRREILLDKLIKYFS